MTTGMVIVHLLGLLISLGLMKAGWWICRNPDHAMSLLNPYVTTPRGSARLQLIWFFGLAAVCLSPTGVMVNAAMLVGLRSELVLDVLWFASLCLGVIAALRVYRRYRTLPRLNSLNAKDK